MGHNALLFKALRFGVCVVHVCMCMSVCVSVCVFSHSVMSDSSVTLWTVAHQAPLSMGLSRQEYWSGLQFPSPEDLPDPGIEPMSTAVAGSIAMSHLESPKYIHQHV